MPSKVSRIPSVQVVIGTSHKGQCSLELDLMLYTVGTFFVVLALYLMIRGWKSCGPPEEVDLGSWPEHHRDTTPYMLYMC